MTTYKFMKTYNRIFNWQYDAQITTHENKFQQKNHYNIVLDITIGKEFSIKSNQFERTSSKLLGGNLEEHQFELFIT